MNTCTVCRHDDRDAIDKALIAGQAVRHIAAQYGLTPTSLQRHKVHIGPRLARALKREEAAVEATIEAHVAEEIASGNDLVADLRALIRQAQEIAVEARSTKQLSVAVQCIDKQSKVLELVARLTGQLDEGTRVNILVQEREQREAAQVMDLQRLTLDERIELERLLEKASGADQTVAIAQSEHRL